MEWWVVDDILHKIRTDVANFNNTCLWGPGSQGPYNKIVLDNLLFHVEQLHSDIVEFIKIFRETIV